MSLQYHLPLPQREAMLAEDFMVTASNREAATWLLKLATSSWPSHCLILYGPHGCGKTHLLTAWCDKHKARQLEIGEDVLSEILGGNAHEAQCCPSPLAGEVRWGGYPLGKESIAQNSPQSFPPLPIPPREGKGATPCSRLVRALAIDGADKIAGNIEHEEWLQHLYNATKAADVPLLLTAMTPPAAWGLGLKDILSRLNSCAVAEIHEPDDELMRGMLMKQFSDRQLMVEPDVIDYLAPRLERTGVAIREAVTALDQKALEQKRKITVPFAQQTFKLADRAPPDYSMTQTFHKTETS